MEKTLEVYIKANSNCPGMPLTAFTMLSPEWQGEHLVIPFGEDEERKKGPYCCWMDRSLLWESASSSGSSGTDQRASSAGGISCLWGE